MLFSLWKSIQKKQTGNKFQSPKTGLCYSHLIKEEDVAVPLLFQSPKTGLCYSHCKPTDSEK